MTKLCLKVQVCSLRISLNPALLFNSQVKIMVKVSVYQLWVVCSLGSPLNEIELATVIHTLVTSRLDYCLIFSLRLPLIMAQKLQLLPGTTRGRGCWY